MQLNAILLYLAMTGAALAMNLTRWEYRHLVFPLVLFLLPFAAARPGVLLKRMSLSETGWHELKWLMAAILLFFPPAFFFYHLVWMNASFVLPDPQSLQEAFNKAVLLALTAAVPEEFFFRGWLQETALAHHAKPAFLFVSRKNLLAAALFGIAHAIAFLNPLAAATFFPSLLFGWLTERSGGSVVPAIVLHAVANLVLFLLFCFIG